MKKTIFAVLAICFTGAAMAEAPAKAGEIRVQIAGQAAREVANDLLAVTLVAEREAETREQAYAAGVAASQKGADFFRKQTEIQVRGSNFYISPVYEKNGQERAFRARYSVRLESRDFQALLKLVGSVADQYSVAGLNFMVSPELRRSTEAQLMTDVVKDIRAKAAALQAELGVARLQLAEIDYAPVAAPVMLRSFAAPAPAAVAISSAKVDTLAADNGVSRIEIGARAVLRGQ